MRYEFGVLSVLVACHTSTSSSSVESISQGVTHSGCKFCAINARPVFLSTDTISSQDLYWTMFDVSTYSAFKERKRSIIRGDLANKNASPADVQAPSESRNITGRLLTSASGRGISFAPSCRKPKIAAGTESIELPAVGGT